MSVWAALGFWLVCWALNTGLARSRFAQRRAVRIAIPVLFGLAVLGLWQGIVVGLSVPEVILPAPSVIGVAIIANLPTLWADFIQTILKGALSGYLLGVGGSLCCGGSGRSRAIFACRPFADWQFRCSFADRWDRADYGDVVWI